jgi:hypothetical protein
MATETWKVKVRLESGALQEVTVRADSYLNARQMIEAQYGKGSIASTMVRV